MDNSRWISLEEAATHLGIKTTTLYKWLERKQLPAHKIGKLWKFKLAELDDWVKSGKAGSEEKEDQEEGN